jgi:hypothetical protein
MQIPRISAVLSLLLALIVGANIHPAAAQVFRGGINGTISDPSGAVVPGAKVTATNVATSISYNAVSSGAGEFVFADLPLGTYKVNVTAAGFQSTDVVGIAVTAGKIYNLPVKMTLAQEATTIQVSAASLTLDTTSFTQNTNIEDKALQDMPLNGRDFTQLIDQSVGFAGYGSNGSVNGTRSNQANWQIDGADNNDLWGNGVAVNQGGVSSVAGVTLPIDSIDEFSFQTAGNSEVGRGPGGVLNLAIKSGTNLLHGSAYYYNRNEALAEQTPFAPPGSKKNALRNQQFGGSVGGPIWRDHTFFFLTYEEQKFYIGNEARSTEPSTAYQDAAKAVLAKYNVPVSQVSTNLLSTFWPASVLTGVAAPNNYFNPNASNGYSHNALVKFDHRINANNNISARWFFGQGYQTAPYGTHISDYYQVVPTHIQNYDVVYNSTITPHIANQVLIGVNYFTQAFSDAVHSVNPSSVGLDTGITNPSLYGAPNVQMTGFDQIGPTPLSGRNDITGHLTDALSWNIGSHEIRLGGEYRQAQIDIYYNFGARGTFTFNGTQGPWANSGLDANTLTLADFLGGYIYQASITRGNQERFLYEHTADFFAQDSWKVSPKLTLIYGLRYDFEQPLYANTKNLSTFLPDKGGLVVAGQGVPSIYPADYTNFAPRIGFAYQPGGNAGLVLRGSYGIYFDQPAMIPFIDNISIPNNGPPGVIGNPIGTDPVYTITQTYQPGTVGWQLNQPVLPTDNLAPTGSNVVAAFSANPNFRTPYAQMYSLNVEKELGPNWMLTLGYVGSESRRNIVIQDINQAAPGSGNNSAMVTGPNGGTFTYQQSTRPYFQRFPNYGVIDQVNSDGNANYNSFQATLRAREWHGLSGQFNYAWSHNLDTFTSNCCNNPEDSLNLNRSYGNSDYDIRHHFSSLLSYDVPGLQWGPHALSHGWELDNVLRFNTGEPFSILVGSDSSGTGENQDRPDIHGSPTAGISRALVQNSYVQWLNPNSFSTPAYGQWGNLRRNQVPGPGFASVDLSVIKNTPIYKERIHSQFRVEMFNLFNRTNLAPPSGALGSGSFGQSSDTIGDYVGAPGIGPGEPFNVQLALKILF